MTSDEPALIDAILANRDDDTPRLAYADWLEENAGAMECPKCFGGGAEHWHGCKTCSGSGRISDGRKERAEFIRVQVELARLPEPCLQTIGPLGKPDHADQHGGRCTSCLKLPRECDYHRLSRRERGLQITACPKWREEQFGVESRDWINAPLPGGLVASGFVNMFYSRGFVSSLTCSWSDWSQHTDAILRAQPIERVRPTDWLPMQNGYVRLELPDGRIYLNGLQDVRMAHLTLAKTVWPRIEFELPPEQNNSATWQFNLDLAAAENR